MLTRTPQASDRTWRLALIVLALQLVLSAGLIWANDIAERVAGRRIGELRIAEGAAPNAPDAVFQPTTLPAERCCATSNLVFRIELTGADAALDDPAVLVVSAHDNAALYVEGVLASGVGRVSGPPSNLSRRPLLLRVPRPLAVPGARVDLVVQRAVGFGHLRPIYIGEYQQLYRSYLALRLLRADIPFANAVIGAFVAVFALCAAPLFGARGLLFSLAGLGAGWAAQHVALLLTDPPWGAVASNGVYFVAFLATLAFAVWFFVEWTSVFAYSNESARWLPVVTGPWTPAARGRLGWAVGAVTVIGAAATAWLLNGEAALASQDINRVLGWLGLAAMAFCLVRILAFYAGAARRNLLEASAFIFVLLAAVADIVMVRVFKTYGVFLGAAVVFFPLALLLSLAARARGVFEAATASAERLSALVAEREREVLAKTEQLRRTERTTMLAEERARIMRDMHDGIGGHLLGLIVQARSQGLPRESLLAGLERSLEDLRLVVASLEQGEGSLTGAIGALRAHIEPRCAAAGVALDWRIEDVGETPQIGPDTTLQIYRILQEASTNALRHGAPRRIAVSMRRASGKVEIALSDDGAGFNPDQVQPGRGLANMRTRARRIGAGLDIRSGERGTELVLALDV